MGALGGEELRPHLASITSRASIHSPEGHRHPLRRGRHPHAGEYKLKVNDVPVGGFWSISVYNADGYFEPNDLNAYSLNNVTAKKDKDCSIEVQFGGCTENSVNCLPIVQGWNYMVRLYRPHKETLDGAWKFPAAMLAK
ncbi:DUF1214 domain-containing protein [Xanthobacter autotrophicus]|uniref:DUF1214 domain-containing protein n=1 Tax=Xanthobacter autotrophicus TaxID=280 RepID=UPI0037266328